MNDPVLTGEEVSATDKVVTSLAKLKLRKFRLQLSCVFRYLRARSAIIRIAIKDVPALMLTLAMN